MRYIIKITEVLELEGDQKYPKTTDVYVQEVNINNEKDLVLPVIKAVNSIA